MVSTRARARAPSAPVGITVAGVASLRCDLANCFAALTLMTVRILRYLIHRYKFWLIVKSLGFREIGPMPACFSEQGGSHRRGGASAPQKWRNHHAYLTKKQYCRSGSSQSSCGAYVRRREGHGPICGSATFNDADVDSLEECGPLARPRWSRHLDEGPRGSGVQVIFVSEVARSATVLHQPLIEPDDVKWRLPGQGAAQQFSTARRRADVVRVCRPVPFVVRRNEARPAWKVIFRSSMSLTCCSGAAMYRTMWFALAHGSFAIN